MSVTPGCLVFVGTVTRPVPHFAAQGGAGIHVLSLNEESGRLATLSVTADAVNPHYLAFDEASSTLFAISEVMEWPEGRVTSYRYDADTATLTIGNAQPTLGHLACFLSLSRNRDHVLVANYGMRPVGSVPDKAFVTFPVANGRIERASSAVSLTGAGPNTVRQDKSHPHCIVALPDGRLACTDLGSDEVLIFAFDSSAGRMAASPDCIVKMPPGSGPRHLVCDATGQRLLVVNEMAATVSVLRREGRGFVLEQTASILPPDIEAPDRYAAAIALSPSGDHIYVSNRQPDGISLLRPDAATGALQLIGCWPSGGKTPRSMALCPNGRFLLAGNQDGGNITVFAVDQRTGALSAVEQFAINAPMCVIAVPQRGTGAAD